MIWHLAPEGEQDGKNATYKLVLKNDLGKILYCAQINGKAKIKINNNVVTVKAIHLNIQAKTLEVYNSTITL